MTATPDPTTRDPIARHRRLLGQLALVATVMTLVVVVLGAWTRLTHSGLGCPDWPGCYGFLSVPQSEAHIAIAQLRFPEAPVDVSKGWPEMIHRYAAGVLSVLVFAIAALAVRWRREGHPLRLPLLIAGFIVLQAAFGMWTVTLKLWPQVVALHLLGGFTLLSLLTLLTLRLRGTITRAGAALAERLGHFRPWLRAALVLVVLQIALGAWTASNYAAVACTDLPTCQGEWWPTMDFRHGFDVTQAVGPNYLGGQLTAEGRVAIHVTHRIGALLVMVVLGALLCRMWRPARDAGIGRWVLLCGGVLMAQIALGLANVWLHIPVSLAMAHNAMGAGLLLSVINLLWRLQPFPVRRPLPKPRLINHEVPA
ncbi:MULTISPECIES: COX15/CtaA family protein [Marinobacter]|uniref:COX15/CtaA family protein n=1 Tax=Marinobacter TaxID=2742 RepID=UPI000DAC06AC|nr:MULTISPECIES: COX15/CtaA family protein [Marinobacter]